VLFRSNCGAIPEGTIDSELFGHEKGSFTGAVDARKGYFEVTNGGTIFLDEIGEMPLGTQARLLRVLENGEFIRVGSSKVQKTDVRVVAATNVNLLDAVHKGRFREDLYYRLSTVPITVPSLRERGHDIELLFRKFASDFAEKYRVKPVQLEPDAVQALLSYAWPGNIRQLKNIAEQVSILELDRTVYGDALRKYLPQQRTLPATLPGHGQSQGTESFSERDLLYKVLFDMRKDMTDLKQMVFLLAQGGTDGATVLENNNALFEDIQPVSVSPSIAPAHYQAPVSPPRTDPFRINKSPISPLEEEDEDATQDIEHDIEEENLSLERKEKELIIKSLMRNANKRKQAARELGISDRTLYRKIKQYAIE
jgi:transcriptional regulator with PAS, ATPase and Fis domain